MPHKLNHVYHSYDTPYGESYSVDTKLWYDDKKEYLPPPHIKTKEIEDFRIASLVGIGDWYFNEDEGFSDLSEDDIKLMVDFCFGKGNDDAYSLGCYFAWKNKKIVFHWHYRYNKRKLEKFIRKVKNNQYAYFYTDCYSSYKIFAYPTDNSKIRLIIQDYYEESSNFLKNLFDGIVDKKYFILTLTSIVKNAEIYLLDYVYTYAKDNKSPEKSLKKAIRIAKDRE